MKRGPGHRPRSMSLGGGMAVETGSSLYTCHHSNAPLPTLLRGVEYSRSTKKVPRSRGGRPAEPPDSSPDSIAHAQAAAVTRVRSRRPASGSVGGGRPWGEDAVRGAQRCRSAEEGEDSDCTMPEMMPL